MYSDNVFFSSCDFYWNLWTCYIENAYIHKPRYFQRSFLTDFIYLRIESELFCRTVELSNYTLLYLFGYRPWKTTIARLSRKLRTKVTRVRTKLKGEEKSRLTRTTFHCNYDDDDVVSVVKKWTTPTHRWLERITRAFDINFCQPWLAFGK